MAEIDETFEKGRGARHVFDCLREVVCCLDPRLSFTVIAKAAGLEDRRRADFGHGGFKLGQRFDGSIWRSLEAQPTQKILFRQPVLADPERLAARTDRAVRLKDIKG